MSCTSTTKRGLDRASRATLEALCAQFRPAQSEREKQQMAIVSAHNDATIGELIAKAIEKARSDRRAGSHGPPGAGVAAPPRDGSSAA